MTTTSEKERFWYPDAVESGVPCIPDYIELEYSDILSPEERELARLELEECLHEQNMEHLREFIAAVDAATKTLILIRNSRD